MRRSDASARFSFSIQWVLGLRLLGAFLPLAAVLALVASHPALAQNKSKSKSEKVPLPAETVTPTQTPAKKDSSKADSKKGDAAKADAPKADKVDISDIEAKYWAPKDTDFTVVQNRTYTKEKRYSASAQVGPVINDQYSEGLGLSFNGNYFFNERMGVQLNYLRVDSGNRDIVDAFIAKNGAPDFGRMKDHIGLGYSWVPFYAKMSVLGQKIIYFDMAFTPSLGTTNYTQFVRTGNKQSSGVTLGFEVTQYFFLSNNLAIRFDYKNLWFQESVLKYYNQSLPGEKPTGAKLQDAITNVNFLLLGATFFF